MATVHKKIQRHTITNSQRKGGALLRTIILSSSAHLENGNKKVTYILKLTGCVAETHRRDDNTRRGITTNKKKRRTATDGGGRRIDRKSQNPEGRWQSLLIGILTEDPGYKSRKTGERQRIGERQDRRKRRTNNGRKRNRR